jgi:hypothetical protein
MQWRRKALKFCRSSLAATENSWLRKSKSKPQASQPGRPYCISGFFKLLCVLCVESSLYLVNRTVSRIEENVLS